MHMYGGSEIVNPQSCQKKTTIQEKKTNVLSFVCVVCLKKQTVIASARIASFHFSVIVFDTFVFELIVQATSKTPRNRKAKCM